MKNNTFADGVSLTNSEIEVLRPIASGMSSKEAAAEICCSARTVEYHLARIYLKLNVSNRVHVVVPTKCIELIDAYNYVYSGEVGIDCHGQSKSLWLVNLTFGQHNNPGQITNGFGNPVHGDGGNALFVDGHVSYKRWTTCSVLQQQLPWLICVPPCSNHVPGGGNINNPNWMWTNQ